MYYSRETLTLQRFSARSSGYWETRRNLLNYTQLNTNSEFLNPGAVGSNPAGGASFPTNNLSFLAPMPSLSSLFMHDFA